jgi:hypothetical protein
MRIYNVLADYLGAQETLLLFTARTLIRLSMGCCALWPPACDAPGDRSAAPRAKVTGNGVLQDAGQHSRELAAHGVGDELASDLSRMVLELGRRRLFA